MGRVVTSNGEDEDWDCWMRLVAMGGNLDYMTFDGKAIPIILILKDLRTNRIFRLKKTDF